MCPPVLMTRILEQSGDCIVLGTSLPGSRQVVRLAPNLGQSITISPVPKGTTGNNPECSSAKFRDRAKCHPPVPKAQSVINYQFSIINGQVSNLPTGGRNQAPSNSPLCQNLILKTDFLQRGLGGFVEEPRTKNRVQLTVISDHWRM